MLPQLQILLGIHVDDDDGNGVVDEIRDYVNIFVIIFVRFNRGLGGDDAKKQRLEDVTLGRQSVPIFVTAFQQVQYESGVARKEDGRIRTQILKKKREINILIRKQ